MAKKGSITEEEKKKLESGYGDNVIVKEIDGETLSIPIGRPPSVVDEDSFYPAKRMRVTQTRADELDYLPQDSWKAFDIADENGRRIMRRGVAVKAYHFIIVSFEALSEDEECSFVDSPLRDLPEGTSIVKDGLFAISGKFINDRIEARRLLGDYSGSLSRRRIEEDQDVVSL
jgi:hypothetical protein